MVVDIISRERLENYLIASGHNEQRALDLYGWNIEISEAFYPLLNAVEVCLRNIISNHMIDMYGQQWWNNDDYLDQIDRGKRIVRAARDKVKRRSAVTSGRMVAELNFGFWTKMLLPRHQGIFWESFNHVFDKLPDEITYDDLYGRCESVCDFRNRIFHHEPIFNWDISKEYQQMMELLKWLSPEKAVWIKDYLRVMAVMRQKP